MFPVIAPGDEGVSVTVTNADAQSVELIQEVLPVLLT